MKAQKHQYRISTGNTRNDEAIVLSLWQTGLEHQESITDKYRWFYVNNAAGLGKIYFLEQTLSGERVGTMCVAPRNWHINEQSIASGILADLVVTPEHRSLGPAVKLHNNSIDLSLEQLDFVYGFPNKKSAALTKLARFQMIDNILRYAKPLRFSRYLQKKMPSVFAAIAALPLDIAVSVLDSLRYFKFSRTWRATEITTFDHRFDELWHAADRKQMIIGQRDRQFLRWRFTDSPARQFSIFAIESSTDQHLGAYLVYYIGKEDAAIVADFFCLDQNNTLPALFLSFSRYMRKKGVSSICVDFIGPEKMVNTLQQLGFKYRDKKQLSCKWTDAFEKKSAGKEWYFTAADNDI